MILSLLRVSMDFIEDIRVSEECTETGFSTEIDRPAAIFGTREIGRICIAEDPSAEGDEAIVFVERIL